MPPYIGVTPTNNTPNISKSSLTIFQRPGTAKCPFKSGRRGTTSDNAQKTHPRRHRGCCCFGCIHPPVCIVSCNHTCLLRTSYSIFNRALKLIILQKNLKSAKFQFEACCQCQCTTFNIHLCRSFSCCLRVHRE